MQPRDSGFKPAEMLLLVCEAYTLTPFTSDRRELILGLRTTND
jgi:hypothetical protein